MASEEELKHTADGVGDPSTLPAAAVDAVRALAAVHVPVTSGGTKSRDGTSDKGPEKAEGEKLSKWAIKKKKLPCYRCGEPGHFMADCRMSFVIIAADLSMRLGTAHFFRVLNLALTFLVSTVRS